MKRFWTYIKHKKTDSGSYIQLEKGWYSPYRLIWETILNNQFQSAFSQKTNITQSWVCCRKLQTGNFSDLSWSKHHMCWYRKNTEKPKPKQGCWTGQLKPRILKELGSDIAPSLGPIFKKSLESGTVPKDWRKTHITPIYKKGQRYKAENYRPVSLTCICCKLM